MGANPLVRGAVGMDSASGLLIALWPCWIRAKGRTQYHPQSLSLVRTHTPFQNFLGFTIFDLPVTNRNGLLPVVYAFWWVTIWWLCSLPNVDYQWVVDGYRIRPYGHLVIRFNFKLWSDNHCRCSVVRHFCLSLYSSLPERWRRLERRGRYE